MGYTHYFKTPKGTKGYDKALPIINKILNRHKDIIRREYDSEESAVANESMICFNGIGEDGHETFVFENEPIDFSFCKTARKPYDLVVCECLIVLNHCIPELSISSDGFCGSRNQENEAFTLGSNIENVDGYWGEAIKNVSELYGINYKAICVSFHGGSSEKESPYYEWDLFEAVDEDDDDLFECEKCGNVLDIENSVRLGDDLICVCCDEEIDRRDEKNGLYPDKEDCAN